MKYEIEIEGLPDGWKAIAIRPPVNDIDYIAIDKNTVTKAKGHWDQPMPILEKIKPRRIVLEETMEDNRFVNGVYSEQYFDDDRLVLYNQPKIWREVTEKEVEK